MVLYWQSCDESQVASDWFSSGKGSTVKWNLIGHQVVSHWHSYDESQVATDWSSSGMGSTLKFCPIGSIRMEAKWRRIGLQVVWVRQSSGITLEVKWHLIGHQVVLD